MQPIKVSLQYLLPKHAVSRLAGWLAAAEAGFITTWLIRLFVRHFKVDMQEAQQSDPAKYKSFNEFFTRPLKEGVREIVQDESRLAYPVDGTVSQAGPIDQDRIFQAKGHNYSLNALMGGEESFCPPFKDGTFATIYLSPRDYHRIHMPMDGRLTDMIYVPGELFSVNPLTTEHVPGLFARNERVVCLFDTDKGRMAMVLVGATIVASIETKWAGTITPPTGKKVTRWQYPASGHNAISLKKGEEMGLFKLGSTVVMLFEADMLELDDIGPGFVTRLGSPFATLKA